MLPAGVDKIRRFFLPLMNAKWNVLGYGNNGVREHAVAVQITLNDFQILIIFCPLHCHMTAGGILLDHLIYSHFINWIFLLAD
jgi:hypothetical protein